MTRLEICKRKMRSRRGWNETCEWLDKHNARTEEENQRLSMPNGLLYRLARVSRMVLRPFGKLNEAIARWEHGQRIAARERCNGPW